jgi:hypothetical protein
MIPALKTLAASSALLLSLAGASFAGTVTGTVRNGTTGKPAAGVEVILIQLQGGMQPVDSTKTDADGHFQITNPGVGGQMPMLLRAVYRDVFYHEPLTPGKTNVDIDVYEPTDKPSAVSVSAHAVIVQPSGSVLTVGEEYSIQNTTQPPLTYYNASGSFLFSLPQGAQLTDVSAAGASGMPVVQGTIDKGKNVKAIAYAFRPGDNEVRITYKLPYSENHAKLRVTSHYPDKRLAVFAPPSVQITGDGFSPAGQEQGFNAYLRENVAANAPVEVSISGSAPAPPPGNSASASAGAPVAGAPASSEDASQNPSVNSRLEESGAEAPTATATTLPARLDSLKWILVGGFAVTFALGFAYLWRRPQVIAATAAGPAAALPVQAAPASPAPPPPIARVSPQPASAAAPLAPAAVPSEPAAPPRGSLDEIKDALFRVELRRQAGTITDDEYARERRRIEQFLRGLVRG